MQDTVDKQRPGSLSYSPILYKGDASKLIQYNPLEELSQLFSLLSADETSNTYQKAAEKTWLLLKKTIVLFLFVVCFIVALPIWVGGIGFQAGFKFRQWLETDQPSLEQIVYRMLEAIAYPFKQAYAWASWFVKQYLNWEVSFSSPPQATPAPAPTTPAKS